MPFRLQCIALGVQQATILTLKRSEISGEVDAMQLIHRRAYVFMSFNAKGMTHRLVWWF